MGVRPARGLVPGVETMTILVKINYKSGQKRGDWVVQNGRRGKILSRHRTKRAAMKSGRRAARSRGTNLKEQRRDGTWKQGPSYA